MKKNTKKLELHRETIRVLSEKALDKAQGGIPETLKSCFNCPSNPTIC